MARIHHTVPLGVLALLLAWAAPASARPVLVELYTSEGCSACPPAEKFLGQLTEREDVLALSFHVTYWDNPAWKDQFGDERFTMRQTIYQLGWRERSNYTPQLVVDGLDDATGNDRKRVDGLITQAKLAQVDVPVTLRMTGEDITVALPERAGLPAADVWLVGFDHQRESTIRGGENARRTITLYRVVRHMEKAGRWEGKKVEFSVPKSAWAAPPEGVVAIVQQEGQGRVMGLAEAEYN